MNEMLRKSYWFYLLTSVQSTHVDMLLCAFSCGWNIHLSWRRVQRSIQPWFQKYFMSLRLKWLNPNQIIVKFQRLKIPIISISEYHQRLSFTLFVINHKMYCYRAKYTFEIRFGFGLPALICYIIMFVIW